MISYVYNNHSLFTLGECIRIAIIRSLVVATRATEKYEKKTQANKCKTVSSAYTNGMKKNTKIENKMKPNCNGSAHYYQSGYWETVVKCCSNNQPTQTYIKEKNSGFFGFALYLILNLFFLSLINASRLSRFQRSTQSQSNTCFFYFNFFFHRFLLHQMCVHNNFVRCLVAWV